MTRGTDAPSFGDLPMTTRSKKQQAKYEVDYQDPAFPRIVRSSEGQQTFRQAKKELLEHLRFNVMHWQTQVNEIRDAKEEDLFVEVGKPLSEIL